MQGNLWSGLVHKIGLVTTLPARRTVMPEKLIRCNSSLDKTSIVPIPDEVREGNPVEFNATASVHTASNAQAAREGGANWTTPFTAAKY